MTLSLKLLGGFAIRDGEGRELSLPTRKTRALLAYLAVNADRPLPRTSLTTLLWDDSGDQHGRHSLNQALSAIRKMAGDNAGALFDSDREKVKLRSEAVDSDVLHFRTRVTDDPTAAAALYEGPFLAGVDIQQPDFEDWLRQTRSELHLLACDALKTAAEITVDTNTALAYARRLVTLDPLREGAHRRLMRMLHQTGNRTGALQQYQLCAALLKRELQVEPDAATTELFNSIKFSLERGVRSRPIAEALTPSVNPAIRPSIAVLPFRETVDDSHQKHLLNDITDDVIAALSKFRAFCVVARNAISTHKRNAGQATQMTRDLGVQYVVEGRVRTVDRRVRIAVQLSDAETGRHLWAERYDLERVDLFAILDEMTATIAAALEQQVNAAERQRVRRTNPKDLNAWDCLQRGLWHYHLRTKEQVEEAGRLFQKATELDPGFAPAHAWRAEQLRRTVINSWATEPVVMRGHALQAARQAVAADRCDPLAHYSLGRIYSFEGDSEAAIAEFEEALSLNPNMALASSGLGSALVWAGRAKDALLPLKMAIRQNPRDPYRSAFDLMTGVAHFMLGENEDAVVWLKTASREVSRHSFWPHLGLATTLSALGHRDESRASLQRALRIKPDLSLNNVAEFLRGQDSKYNDRYLEGLQKMKLPE